MEMTKSPVMYTGQAIILAAGLAMIALAVYKLYLFIAEQGPKLSVSQIAFWLEILGNLCSKCLFVSLANSFVRVAC